MEKIVFAEGWQKFFADCGLETFADFFEYTAGERINKNTRRDVITFTLTAGSEEKRFFMKRFFRPHFKDMLFAWCNSGKRCSQGKFEWENARLLLCGTIPTYRPTCFGENICCGIERQSFSVTEELQGRAFTEFVTEKWADLDRPQKEKIIADLGRFVRRIHDLQLSLPDLYLWHFYVTNENQINELDYAIIDLHRMRRGVSGWYGKVKNLGALDHSMTEKYFDDDLRMILLKAYAATDSDRDLERLVKKVKSRSRHISGRRNPKEY